MRRAFIAILLTAATIAGCDDTTGPAGTATVGLAFTTALGSAASTAEAPSLRASDASYAVTVEGTNGTLTVDEIYVIVSELELEGELAACDSEMDGEDDDGEDREDCEEFESEPSLVQISADGTPHQVATANVPLGTYTELEWEVEDLDLDEAEDDEEELQRVRADIDAAFGEGVWPAGASMAVSGSFLPAGATEAVAFTTFFDAEIEVEMELNPALVLSDEGASRQLTIVLSPELWFTNSDGSVINLAELSGELVEFEAEFEDGVVEIEHDDDDDNGDDD